MAWVRTDFPVGTPVLSKRQLPDVTSSLRGVDGARRSGSLRIRCAVQSTVTTNADTCLGFGGGETTPRIVIRQGDWEQVADTELRTLPDGRHEAVWVVNPRASSFDFAFCYPYLPDDLAHTLAECSGYWHEDAIGVTQKGRPLTRLANAFGNEPAQAAGIYVIARQHAGETPGSWVLDGLLRHAQRALDPAQILLWAVPFAHLDGVVEGDYGKDPFPTTSTGHGRARRCATRCSCRETCTLGAPLPPSGRSRPAWSPEPPRRRAPTSICRDPRAPRAREATRAAAYIREPSRRFIREQPDVQATLPLAGAMAASWASRLGHWLSSLCLETPLNSREGALSRGLSRVGRRAARGAGGLHS